MENSNISKPEKPIIVPVKQEVPKRVNGKSDMRRVIPAAIRLFGKGHK